MENKSGAFRKKKVYFSQISNLALRDRNLSLKAKGLYALIQSYITIENFTLYKTTLKKECLEKEKAFETTWKELKEKGYLIQYRLQGNKGYFYYEYELLDTADKELADKIHSNQNRKTQDEKNHNPKKIDMDKNIENHNPKMDTMDDGYGGKVGVYNNTNSNNTNSNNTNLSSSSISNDELILNFNNNICELKKTTKPKFIDFCNKYDSEFINAIIEYSAEINIRSYKGFETIIKSYIDKEVFTVNDFINSIEKYRAEKKEKNNKKQTNYKNSNIKELKFNNFDPREYDYDKLEKKLLGWDK